jgi:hypothetical protein
MRLPGIVDPLPTPTASFELPAGVVLEAGSEPLSEAHGRITEALTAAGFAKWGVFAYKDGIAVVAQWEHIEDGGRPARRRFPARHPRRIRRGFDFEDHAQLLFNAPDGEYRLFVITVAGSGAPTANISIDGDETEAGQLPDELSDHPSTDRVARANVYIYRQEGSNKAELLTSSPLDAAKHLAAAGIFSATPLTSSPPQ